MSNLSVNYDSDRDVLTVEGVHYSGELFRQFGLRETHPSRLMKIINRGGVLDLKIAHDPDLAMRFEQALSKPYGGSVIHRA